MSTQQQMFDRIEEILEPDIADNKPYIPLMTSRRNVIKTYD